MSTLSRPPLGLVQTSANAQSRPANAKPSIAQGGAMSAIRSSKYAAPTTTTTTAPPINNTNATTSPKASPVAVKPDVTSTPALSRSGGAVGKNSPSEPAQPSSTTNPRSTMLNTSASRELFPASSAFNSTQPSVSRSSTFSRGADVSALHAKFGFANPSAMHQLPTANMSLDSATFGSLLHTRDSKFLIPPFRMQTTMAPPSQTPDLMSVAGRETPGAAPTMSVESPTRKVEPSYHAPVCYYTIVFDLDETLCCNRGPGKAILRPGALELLKSLRALSTPQRPVEIILWTASVESLARQVLVRLDPDESVFTDYVFRDRRWFKETGYTKDLRLLGRDMEHVVIIENSPMSVTLNRQQSILVKDFLGHAPHDCDLKVVKEVLEGWITADDFVPIREWLAQHPKIDRNNNIIAAPSLSTVMAARTGINPTSSTAVVGGIRRVQPVGGGPLRHAAAIPVFAGRRW